MTRIGNGYDSHRVAEGRELWLGCVHFDDAPAGLEGHSDADIVAHAICDALLGAAGLEDIGRHFPDTDDKYAGYPGRKFLEEVADMVYDAGYEISNVDCVVLCESVRIAPRREQMVSAIADALDIDDTQVNVKATTNEGRGAVGRGEIIACYAVASIEDA